MINSTLVGWGKAVPIPKNPVFVPVELQKLSKPPPVSGMPFNAQLHESDIKRCYQVPNTFPRSPQPSTGSLESDKVMKEAYDEFMAVFARSKIIVIQPSDRELLKRIHKTIEYLLKEGPVFEAIVIAREGKNPAYSFLYNNRSSEHAYYRWKLYSLLHGDSPYAWSSTEFQMFKDGPLWIPPPLNPYAQGMPQELIDKAIVEFEALSGATKIPSQPLKQVSFVEEPVKSFPNRDEEAQRPKGYLSSRQQETLGEMLRTLKPTRPQIGAAMVFCITYADAANDIIEIIYKSLCLLETPLQRKLARLFLVSDILHNCSAAVTNASFYRKGFQAKLVSMFEYLREYLVSMEDCYKADKFKHKILVVLGAWKEWTLYEDEFLIQLSNILLGLQAKTSAQTFSGDCDQVDTAEKLESIKAGSASDSADLDGAPVDEAQLASCLEAKGLSLRWYRALELSDNEEEDGSVSTGAKEQPPPGSGGQRTTGSPELVRFKSSKWETVDPVEVVEQVVTISKWQAMAQAEDQSPASTTTGPSDESAASGSPAEVAELSTRKKSRLMEDEVD